MIHNSNRSGHIVSRTDKDTRTVKATSVRSGKITMGEAAIAKKTKITIRRERIVASKDGLKVVEVR